MSILFFLVTNCALASGININSLNYQIVSSVTLRADGAGGKDTYNLIREKFGPKAIESPDLYNNNHTGFKHIQESTDSIVGNYFVFFIHRDLDHDRNKYPTISDRQRNEIKTYKGSVAGVKGREGETMIFSWKFYINPGMAVSKNFTHFFQLKPVGSGDDRHPLVTLTGFKNQSGRDIFEIRFSPSTHDFKLIHTDWADVRGRWLKARCIATFSEKGYLRFDITTLDDQFLLSTVQNNIDMWRGNESGEAFIRPKWGIYRSLRDKDKLRTAQEPVYFADFMIQKLKQK